MSEFNTAIIWDPQLENNEYPAEALAPPNHSLMAKYLTPEIWAKYKDEKTATAGWTMAKAVNTGCVNKDSLVGCHAGDIESYTVFKDFFDPVIETYHGLQGKEIKQVTDLDPTKLVGDIEDKSNIKSTRIRTARNLFGFPLNPGGTKETRLEIESLMRKVFDTLEGDLQGTYYSLESLTDEERAKLVADHFLFKPGDRFQTASGYHAHWPAGRGIFHNDDKTFLVWLNEGDHIRIISMEKGGDVTSVFSRLCRAVKAIESGIKQITGQPEAFLHDDRLGQITCCPSNLGTGLRGGVHIVLPTLFKTKGLKELDKLARELGCQIRGTHGEHTEIVDTCDISNFHRLGYPEYALVQNMINTVNYMNNLEKEAKVSIMQDYLVELAQAY